MPKMSNYRMAQKLHRKLLDDTYKLQAKILHIKHMIAEFGDEAIHPESLLRDYNDSLVRSREYMARSIELYRESIADNLEVIRTLEIAFKEQSEEDMRNFSDFMRQRAREAK